MALTSRKKRPLDRSIPHHRDTRLIIIATEDRYAPEQYFKIFRDTRVQVRVLPTGLDGKSSPQHVFERLISFCDEFQIGEGDELWFMVDLDRQKNHLGKIVDEAVRRNYKLAISNPCFEVWLLMHFQDPPKSATVCQTIEDALKMALGGSYNKANLNISQFAEKLDFALERAERLAGNSQDRWPQHVGSHVYRVVRSIRGLVS